MDNKTKTKLQNQKGPLGLPPPLANITWDKYIKYHKEKKFEKEKLFSKL